jgi:hypothetical protein
MNSGKLLTLGAGALACLGACAAVALIPALLAGGGLALMSEQLAGWQTVAGLALLTVAAIWLLGRRRAKQASCACAERNAEVSHD